MQSERRDPHTSTDRDDIAAGSDDGDPLESVPGREAAILELAQSLLDQARLHPLRMLGRLALHKALLSAAALLKSASPRTAGRFIKSASKRDPRRPLVVDLGNIPASIVTAAVLDVWDREIDEIAETALARLAASQDAPAFSIVVPVYDPEPGLLRRMIASLRAQSYTRWQLCLADDASTDPAVRRAIEEEAARDERIAFVFRETNGHISAATNSALALATGDFVALVDQDDLLHRHALALVADRIVAEPGVRIVYTDEDKIDATGKRFDPHFKPDWNRELFYAINYVSHLSVFRRDLLEEIGGFRAGFEGAQDYDLMLRAVLRCRPDEIAHVRRILYHWRAAPGSTAADATSKPYASEAGRRALEEHLAQAEGRPVEVALGRSAFTYVPEWPLPDPAPKVSIIIPTRDALDVTKRAVESVLGKTDYANFEIAIVDNGSVEPQTLAWFDRIARSEPRVRVLKFDQPFNYSAINNFAVEKTEGELVALLNNDVEVINRGWLAEMVSLACRKDVGAVGAKLYYPDGSIQHAGVVIGIGGVAGHSHKHFARRSPGYFRRLELRQEYTAVTAACLVIRREIYRAVGGLDETNLAVAFNDVDFCLKVREAGYRNLWTPRAELVHHESVSRGYEDTPAKRERFRKEVLYMLDRWKIKEFADPAYNPNLSLDREDFSLRLHGRSDSSRAA